jgi:uncharacterized protein YndB with AHSA1/START domain
MSDLTLTLEREIKAPAEKVYNAWLNPEMLAKFMIPGEGMTVPKAEATPEVGGRFDIVMAAGDQELPHGGEYKQLSPFSLIVFTWESPFSVEGSTVTLKFTPTETGTHIELIQVKFADEESRSNHQGGWTSILGVLDTVLQ